ncbi:MAG: MFS transporter [Clostridia bacterium]|nr:MFS transporter [Clostridia bacterium]
MSNQFSKKNWFILILFGIIGQIAWSVENMYFNLFVFETISPNLDAITLMVQLSGITATVVTLFAGALSDKLGNRREFISIGYIIWGITVALFGFIETKLFVETLNVDVVTGVTIALTVVIVGDCVMTVFGSTANDAAFNAWVTDNTEEEYRGKVEGVLAVLPLFAMLVVAGGFGILVSFIGYKLLFLLLGIIISIAGIIGINTIKDSKLLKPSGSFKDIFYGFKPIVIKNNKPLYLTLLIVGVYGIACQIFMPFLIIYMKTYLGFSVIEYSLVFGLAIVLGAVINVILGAKTDKMDKTKVIYIANAIFVVGLMLMYLFHFEDKIATILTFGLGGFIMIVGFILISALTGALVRDYTPSEHAGKLQGVRMIFSVLIPMIIGPMIGNAINKAMNIPLVDAGADAMTTEYIPAPEIFLVASLVALIIFVITPILIKTVKKLKEVGVNEVKN